jgi:uncharacterized LabA/DUF88 family protein
MTSPFPAFLRPDSRVMVFVDGENLAIRYKALLGVAVPAGHVVYIEDRFVWSSVINSFLQRYRVIRKYYFTAASGDDDHIANLEQQIRASGFEAPRVYKKIRGRSAKRVDVAMCCEMLSHGLGNNFDCAIVISGDGDFVPAIEALIRGGKQVVLWYVANGANHALINSADHSFDLSSFFMSADGEPWNIMRSS